MIGRCPRPGLTFIEICVALTMCAVVMMPVLQSYFHSVSIVRVTEREFQVLNLGSSFTAQVKQLRRTQLAETELPDFRLDDPNRGLVSLPGAGNVSIRLPLWNAELVNCAYRAVKFSPGGRFGAPGSSDVPLLVELTIAWQERIGGQRTARFGVLLTQ